VARDRAFQRKRRRTRRQADGGRRRPERVRRVVEHNAADRRATVKPTPQEKADVAM
jgi:hypothetical protein